MGLLLLFMFVCFGILSLILIINTASYLCIYLCIFLSAISITCLVLSEVYIGDMAGDNYLYESKVTLNCEESKTTIFFDEFKQKENKIIIKNYAIGRTIHFLDFKRYDIYNEELIILLLDNDNKFIYKETKTEKEFNRMDYAVQ